jgi:hypothetical protein
VFARSAMNSFSCWNLEFMCGTSLEAPRVMEDEFVIAPENQLVLNVVFPALACIGEDACRVRVVVIFTPLDPSTWVRSIWSHGLVGHPSRCIKQSTHLVTLSIIDLRVLDSVTDRAENGGLASVRPPDDKDPEAAKFLSDIFITGSLVCL